MKSNDVPQIGNPGGKERTGVSKLTNQKLLITKNYVKTNLAIGENYFKGCAKYARSEPLVVKVDFFL